MRSQFVWIVVLSGLLLAACGESEPPVAGLTVEPSELALAYPEVVDLHFAWRDRQELAVEPRVFVHLSDASGELVRTFDHAFPRGWAAGSDGTDSEASYKVPIYQSAIAPALPAGRYSVSVGLYGPNGERWSLDVDGERGDGSYEVAKIEVSDVVGDLPIFHFSAEWLGSEFGNDRQILARRWLGEPGRLEVRNVGAPGALWLRLAAPADAFVGHRLELGEGEVQPSVLVTSGCDDTTARIAAGEFRELEIEVPADCELVVEPNYAWVEVGTGKRRAVAVEAIAWSRGG